MFSRDYWLYIYEEFYNYAYAWNLLNLCSINVYQFVEIVGGQQNTCSILRYAYNLILVIGVTYCLGESVALNIL